MVLTGTPVSLYPGTNMEPFRLIFSPGPFLHSHSIATHSRLARDGLLSLSSVAVSSPPGGQQTCDRQICLITGKSDGSPFTAQMLRDEFVSCIRAAFVAG